MLHIAAPHLEKNAELGVPYFLSVLIFLFWMSWSASMANASQYNSPKAKAEISTRGIQIFFQHADRQTFVIDYSALDDFLRSAVVNFGPSERRAPHRMGEMTGSNIVFGHHGPTALEGNRVAFSLFSEQNISGVSHLRLYLEKIAQVVSFEQMTLDQQLSYWINLHNIALIEQIASHYPVAFPEKIRIGPRHIPLQEAKIIHVRGIALSLKDIRENIVYPQWRDPLVFYGFFRGVVAGPNVQTTAYTPRNLWPHLQQNANEFVNSLRGVAKGRNAILVSPLYREMQAALNMNDERLRTHLYRYANDQVKSLLDHEQVLKIGHYYGRVADLSGGETSTPVNGLVRSTQIGLDGSTDVGQLSYSSPQLYTPGQLPPQASRLLLALHEKFYRLRRKGYVPKVYVGEDHYLTTEELLKQDKNAKPESYGVNIGEND